MDIYLAGMSIYVQDSQREDSPIDELQRRLGISISSPKASVYIMDQLDDKELLDLSSSLAGESLPTSDQVACIQVDWIQGDLIIIISSFVLNAFLIHVFCRGKNIQALREHWKNSSANSIRLQELGPLLRDYQRLIIHDHV